ncbi:MAG TPA: phosphatase PAP2 family protein [Sphingobacteriaceae bacterium]
MTASLILNAVFSQTELFLAVNRHGSCLLDGFFLAWTWLGNGLAMILTGIALLFVKFRYSILVLLTYAYTSLSVQILKRLFDAPRPVQFYQGAEDIRLVPGLEMHHWHSFPSGHAVTAFALATVLAALVPPPYKGYTWLLVAVAAVAAFSRVYLAQHFVLDIVVGSVLGVFMSFHLNYVLLNSRWYRSDQLEGRVFGPAR